LESNYKVNTGFGVIGGISTIAAGLIAGNPIVAM